MAQVRPFRGAAGSAGVAPRLAPRKVARSKLLVLLAALISFFVSVFYGGWITSDVVGPFKGEPGSEGW